MLLNFNMFFRNKLKNDNSIQSGVDNLAVLLKGASLSMVEMYSEKFKDCFIVSDYNDELDYIGHHLLGKNIVHFTNRSKSASLSKVNYQKYNIKNIQTAQVFRLNHYRLMQTYLYYKRMAIGLKVHFLPESLLKFHIDFGPEYALKFPNTGIISLIYSLEIIRPKVLWVFGLDFYSTPYMVDQTLSTSLSLEQQAEKMARLDLPNYVSQLFRNYPDTKIMMASHYPDWPDIDNLIRIK